MMLGEEGIKTRASVVHEKAVRILDKNAPRSRTGLIPFKAVYWLFSVHFHLNREESRQLIRELAELGYIQLAKFRGIYLGGGGSGGH